MAGTVRDNLLSGQVVANYRVGRLIGRGGMGAVYEVVHQYLGRRAALKVLHSQFTQTPELAARFVNEARAANVVQHPSVVSVFEIGQLEDGTRYILMEYLDGPRLSQRIRELAVAAEPPAGEQRSAGDAASSARVIVSIRLVRQLASALRALHEKGVIHREQYAPSRNAVRSFQKCLTATRARWKEFSSFADLPSVTAPRQATTANLH